jgi:hypothetical protein
MRDTQFLRFHWRVPLFSPVNFEGDTDRIAGSVLHATRLPYLLGFKVAFSEHFGEWCFRVTLGTRIFAGFSRLRFKE